MALTIDDFNTTLTNLGIDTQAQFQQVMAVSQAIIAGGWDTPDKVTKGVQMATLQLQLNAVKLQLSNLDGATQTALSTINTQRTTLQSESNALAAQITALLPS